MAMTSRSPATTVKYLLGPRKNSLAPRARKTWLGGEAELTTLRFGEGSPNPAVGWGRRANSDPGRHGVCPYSGMNGRVDAARFALHDASMSPRSYPLGPP